MSAHIEPKPNFAYLLYDAPSRWLSGKIGERTFGMRAESGGGRASTTASAWQTGLKSYLATTPEIKDRHGTRIQRGGTLPPGTYTCKYLKTHSTFHECVRLVRDASSLHCIASPFASHPIPHHRGNDFFIHGRGKLGSDGCIVPMTHAERMALTHAIRDFAGTVLLTVWGVP